MEPSTFYVFIRHSDSIHCTSLEDSNLLFWHEKCFNHQAVSGVKFKIMLVDARVLRLTI